MGDKPIPMEVDVKEEKPNEPQSEPVSPSKRTDGVNKKKGRTSAAPVPANDHRHKMTEEEEDKVLLEQEGASEDFVLFDKSPAYIKNGELRDYQVRGLNWLIQLQKNRFNGILADEMGLGKTLQTISLLGYMKHYRNHDGPFLVIVPKSTIQNWKNEFTKWCPTINVVVLIGSQEEREDALNKIKDHQFDAVVTSYEMVLKCTATLKKHTWFYMVIDEAHRIKNEHSKLAETVRLLRTKNRLLLTGTPLQNNLHELWALLNFLLPDIFNSSDDFDSWFKDESLIDNDDVIKRLHRVLQPFLLRRIKADVEKSLLPKKELKIYIGLSAMQRDLYTKILMKDIDVVNTSGKVEKKRLMNLLMHLRKCSNHPYLFDGVEPQPFTTDQHLIDNCGKMVLLDKLLKKLQEQGSRVLIFSQMSRMLDILEDYCCFRGHQYCRLDGQTPHDLRQQQIDEYNRDGSKKFLFMLTTRAGGLGINLTTADVVIIYDSDWNPQMDLQAMDRAHRIGQKKQVRVFRFVTENTVEERIIQRAEMKLRLDSVVIQQGRLAEAQKTLGADEMLTMIRHGAQQIFASKDATITDDDIDQILEKAEEKTKELNDKLEGMGENNLRNFTTEGGSIYDFEGENYKGKANLMGYAFIEPPKRERKANYNIDRAFKEAARAEAVTKSNRPPRPKNVPTVLDFQFFPKKLYELIDNEIYYFRKSNGYDPATHVEQNDKESEKYVKEERKKIEKSHMPSDEELALRDELLQKGFDWSKREFTAFVKACERYGRNDHENIAKDLATRSLEQVKEYSETFWKRFKEVSDYEKIIQSIEKGESRLKRKKDTKRALEIKFNQYKDPYHQLTIRYGNQRSKNFIEDEDRFLICKLYELGYDTEDVYERLRKEVRECKQFRFDWYIRSRTAAELARRCNALIPLIEKEVGELPPEESCQKASKRMNGTPSSVKGVKRKR